MLGYSRGNTVSIVGKSQMFMFNC